MTFDTVIYWNKRYRRGKNSGAGSRGQWGDHKVDYVNRLIMGQKVDTLIDWGCGDGMLASRFQVAHYVGLDVSPFALGLCARACGFRPGWGWCLYDGFDSPWYLPPADLALSLDVIFHLVDDAMYYRHLELLFTSAPLVAVHSSNRDEHGHPHVRHREFTRDIPSGWSLVEKARDKRPEGISMWLFKKAENS